MTTQPRDDALTDPFSVYPTPQAVLDDEHLATVGKLRILRAMEDDLVALQTAEGENMPGDERQPASLPDVRQAIRTLDPEAEAHREHGGQPDTTHAATLSPEQARQAELVLKTRKQRVSFAVYAGLVFLLFVVVLVAARPWA